MVQLREVLAALIIFVATYLFLAGAELPFLKLDRPGGAVAGGVAMVALGVLTPAQVYRDAISWDTLVLLLGMMVITSVMARAGIFRWIAWVALRRAHGPRALLAVLVLVAGTLSALLVNDTVCVMCTPLVVALVEAAALPALPYLLGLAFSSNAGSVATLTGNPQNMLIGTLSGISYAQFSKALLLPALLSLAAVLAVLLVAFRRDLSWKRISVDVPAPPLDRKLALLCTAGLAFVLAGFLLGYDLAWTAMTGAALLLALSRQPPKEMFAQVDGTLLLFFAGLFVVTHGVAQAGIAERIHSALAPALGSDATQQTVRFGVFTVAACQIVSNVPFVLLAAQWVRKLADPHLGWLSLALVSTLAGNLTPVASVANLIVLELAGDKGKIPFLRFLWLGALCTFIPLAVGVGCLLVERGYF
ncbi:MAG: anion transporter [Deltaproteobacteria bacterium]|nr:MAG: anion transporter [Deltaproteobacteria bacterium]TMB34450.1 MAG: anion transporter [Deltaproteobacteria bacterium]